MQIHELTSKKPLNEVDLAGPGGLWAGIKAAGSALTQPGGTDALKSTLTPGAKQGFGSTAAQATSDFTKLVQAAKNNAAMKQVAANMQAQWEQHRKQFSPMSAAKLPLPEAQQSSVAAGLTQLTDWYKQTLVPKDYASFAAEYLKEPLILTTLKKIADAEKLGDAERLAIQRQEFENLVAQTSAKSQQITAKNPQVAKAKRPAAPRTSSVQTAQTNISKVASVTPAQLAQIEKIIGTLPPVVSRDPNTVNYLRALGFNVQ